MKKPGKKLKGTEKSWIKLLKPALIIASPYFGMAVTAKTKNPEKGNATGSILNSIAVGKVLSKTDVFGNGLRLEVIRKYFKKSFYN